MTPLDSTAVKQGGQVQVCSGMSAVGRPRAKARCGQVGGGEAVGEQWVSELTQLLEVCWVELLAAGSAN